MYVLIMVIGISYSIPAGVTIQQEFNTMENCRAAETDITKKTGESKTISGARTVLIQSSNCYSK